MVKDMIRWLEQYIDLCLAGMARVPRHCIIIINEKINVAFSQENCKDT